jgi:hypothetical protein
MAGSDVAGKLHKYFTENCKWTQNSTSERAELGEIISYTFYTGLSLQANPAFRLQV